MIKNIQDLIHDKGMELARQTNEIIEREIKIVCAGFNCTPDDLILEFHQFNEIKIKVQASHFKITHQFTCNGKEVGNDISAMQHINAEDYK